ncbi:glycoside hydrolase family 43 protein [Marinoscillum sp. MHG1-6]|uniref:glycoside hydrolase family 43 protein n=1 Tax=Marinoscillum sp. MHG1-6 TaxID=2959627 RepID=UPI00215733F3|nr:glycoside hydrolase family 43 protein [Marinoscillum sp. MHG1-6]
MIIINLRLSAFICLTFLGFFTYGQFGSNPPQNVKLKDMNWRDVCILPDTTSGYYYMVGPGGKSVLSYRSKDLINWENPTRIFTIPDGFWSDADIVNIWAPELHAYKGKYYLFLTINTNDLLEEQWHNWRPRVKRGSQVLVSNSPTGPFEPFSDESTLPPEMMTLDATLWEEDGNPYIVYAHEWVQISNGTIEYLPLKDDLSEVIGEPKLILRGSDGPWVCVTEKEGSYITDGPYLRFGKNGRLMMIWTSFCNDTYKMGVSFSESGKLDGPWTHQEEAIYSNDGGHGMLFESFDGKLMTVLHSPNNKKSQPRIFELIDTGKELRIKKELR